MIFKSFLTHTLNLIQIINQGLFLEGFHSTDIFILKKQ